MRIDLSDVVVLAVMAEVDEVFVTQESQKYCTEACLYRHQLVEQQPWWLGRCWTQELN